MSAGNTVPVPAAWDQRLEKYGWYEELAGNVSDYGVTLSIGQDAKGLELMIMSIENAHIESSPSPDQLRALRIEIESDEAIGMTRIQVPMRRVVGCFASAIDTLVIKTDADGATVLENGPKNAHGGILFFHVLEIDHPETIGKFQFRSGYNDKDVERRWRRRTGRAEAA